jgi:hypothetical protein
MPLMRVSDARLDGAELTSYMSRIASTKKAPEADNIETAEAMESGGLNQQQNHRHARTNISGS